MESSDVESDFFETLSSQRSDAGFGSSIATGSSSQFRNDEPSDSAAHVSPLPPGMRLLHDLKVILCESHGCCYTKDTVVRHVRDEHHIFRRQKRRFAEWIIRQPNVASSKSEVPAVRDDHVEILGLPVHEGWQCRVCLRRKSRSLKHTKTHCNQCSVRNSWSQGVAWKAVKLQTLWTQKKDQQLFVVIPEFGIVTATTPSDSESPLNFQLNEQLALTLASPSTSQSVQSEGADAQHGNEAAAEPFDWARIIADYHKAQQASHQRYSQINSLQHISEATPWLKNTGFHAHLQKLDHGAIEDSYAIPTEEGHYLKVLADSVDRILRKAMRLIRTADEDQPDAPKLSRLNRRVLNTFNRKETSQDPINHFQEEESVRRLVRYWAGLLCYLIRVVTGEALNTDLFAPTEDQDRLLFEVYHFVQSQDAAPVGEEDEEVEKERMKQLDTMVLQLSVSIIQHPLGNRAFDSVLISYAAILSWNVNQGTWMKVKDYSSLTSYLVYAVQMVILLHCFEHHEERQSREFRRYLADTCREWLLSDCDGPMAELLSIRLLAMKIGRTEVKEAKVFWHQDGLTLTFEDIVFSRGDLQRWTAFELERAERIFYEELCLGLENVPVYEASKLVDNFSAVKPGLSFVDDSRNRDYLRDSDTWLIDALRSYPHLLSRIMKKDARGRTRINADFAHEYELSVQSFLTSAFVLTYNTSGQPTRKREFREMRWRNVQADKRNVFIHDRFLCFVLMYGKSINITNKSRFPVRFWIPGLAKLMIGYFTVIMPFRQWLSQGTGVPEEISEYIWVKGKELWTQEAMLKKYRESARLAIGKKISISAWRQIAIGMAIKFFGSHAYDLALDSAREGEEEEGEEEEEGTIPMPKVISDALHYQANHGPTAGNNNYGGTVDFHNGLTDTALQEFLYLTQCWWKVCSQRSIRAQKSHKRAGTSTNAINPIIKRVIFREGQFRSRRRWTMDQAHEVLTRMYGANARYKTEQQELAMRAVLNGDSQVMAILATAEGKSLLFLLPSQLPGACTTVVLLPLLALKSDLVRRCRLANIQFREWSVNEDESNFWGCPLIFASTDAAAMKPLKTFLWRLDAEDRLDRVGWDEAHLIVTASDYRLTMLHQVELRQLHCQQIFLTGSLPPSMMGDFQEQMALTQPTIIRSITFRKDIPYRVTKIESETVREMEDVFVEVVSQQLAGEAEQSRYIVCTRSKAKAQNLAEKLGCEWYHSESGTVEEKTAVFHRWIKGEHRVICCTTAFGAGVDYPHVRKVLYYEMPLDAVELTQGSGRSGRDGAGGYCEIFVAATWAPLGITGVNVLRKPQEVVVEQMLATETCRCAVLSSYLDQRVWYCGDDDRKDDENENDDDDDDDDDDEGVGEEGRKERRRWLCDLCERRGLMRDRAFGETVKVDHRERMESEEEHDQLNECGETEVGEAEVDNERLIEFEEEAEAEKWPGRKESLMVSEEEETVGEEESAFRDAESFNLGASLVASQLSIGEAGKQAFLERLRLLRGSCMLCKILRREVSYRHTFAQCRREEKVAFLAFRERMIKVARQKGRRWWFDDWAGCWGCLMPIDLCDRKGRIGEDGRWVCENLDMLGQMVWATYHEKGWREGGKATDWLGRLAGYHISDELRMDEDAFGFWMGKKLRLFGMNANATVKAAMRVLDVLTKGVVRLENDHRLI